MLLKLAWRNLWRNRKRSFITMASVAFAVFFAVLMRSLQLGSYERMVQNSVEGYTGMMQIHLAGYWENPSPDLMMEEVFFSEIKERNLPIAEQNLIPRMEVFALASTGATTRGIMITGMDPEKENRFSKLREKLVSGSLPKKEDESLLISQKLAEQLGVQPGDTVVLLGQGRHGTAAAGKFVVAGIVRFPNPELNAGLVFMPIMAAGNLFNCPGCMSAVIVETDHQQLPALKKELKSRLAGSDYQVMDWKEMLPELVQAIQADSAGGIIVIAILYLIIAFGIFGTVLMMTLERMYEFGVLIAIGMRRTRLFAMLQLEGFFLLIAGMVVGMAMSLPAVVYFYFHPIELTGEIAEATEAYGVEAVVPTSLDPEIFYSQVIIVFLISGIIMLYPAVKISKLSITTAMRA